MIDFYVKQYTSHIDSAWYDTDLIFPDSKVQGANMGPIWGRQDPGGSHVGPMNFALWVMTSALVAILLTS